MSSSLPKQSLPADLPADAAAVTHLLLNNPPFIEQWRSAFFLLIQDIEFDWVHFQTLWPYMDNFWSRMKIGKINKVRWDNHYRCQFWRLQGKSASTGKKNKPMTITKEYNMRFKISMYYLDGFAVPDRVK